MVFKPDNEVMEFLDELIEFDRDEPVKTKISYKEMWFEFNEIRKLINERTLLGESLYLIIERMYALRGDS
ncbi:hypothetical protein HYV88_04835 [Candidatus Woesearchaeota archaeon]|nr:hypothetical protein [Candidatus Woesearchaeota archaeon]